MTTEEAVRIVREEMLPHRDFTGAWRVALKTVLAALDEAQRDRYDALSVTSKEGLLASEWVARTGRAERERDEARGERDVLQDKLSSVTEDYIKERNAAQQAEAALAAEQQCRAVEQRERGVAQLALITERERSERLADALRDLTFDEWGAPTCWPTQERVMALLVPEVKP